MAVELLKGIRPLARAAALRDLLAGVTLASMNIPQLLGYARIAGMPAVAGLYTGVLPLIGFALFGASRHLVVAADSATATILSARLSEMAPAGSAEYMALAAMTALLTGLMLLIARLFKLGFLADFLSRTVLVGFLTGVGLQVGIAMLGEMLGIATPSRHTLDQLAELVSGLPALSQSSAVLAASALAIILIMKRLKPRWPVPMLVVVAATAASAMLHWSSHGIEVIGPVAGGLPSLSWPRVTLRQGMALLSVAASCVAIIIAQSAATSRVYAARYHERTDEDANLLGLAAANAAAGLSGAFVVNGSPTQTAMAEQAGARSQIAQLAFGATIVVVLLFLSRWLQFLPRCVLGSIVFTIAVGLVDVRGLRAIRRESPGEFTLAVITAASVLAIGVENAILLAIALSILRHVRQSYQPHTSVLTPDEQGHRQYVRAAPGQASAPGVLVYRFGADLFFANEHRFVDEALALVAHAPEPVRELVIDASSINHIDYTAGRSVCDLCAQFRARGVTVLFARVNPFLREAMERHGIIKTIGADHVFSTLHEALAQTCMAPATNGNTTADV